MSNLNEVNLIGRLGEDPKVVEVAKDKSFIVCKIVTNHDWEHEDEKKSIAQWHTVEAGKYSNFVKKHCAKGDLLFVKGCLRTREWEKDGQKRRNTVVVAKDIQRLHKKAESSSEAKENT